MAVPGGCRGPGRGAGAGRGPGRRDRAARGRMREPGERPGRRAGWPAECGCRQARGARPASRHGQPHSGRRAGRPGCRAADRRPGCRPRRASCSRPVRCPARTLGCSARRRRICGPRGHRPGQPGRAVVLPPGGLHPGQGHRRPLRGLALPALRASSGSTWPPRTTSSGAGARHDTLVRVVLPAAGATWINPGACYNAVGYWHVGGAPLVYRHGGQQRSIGIASLISWRGRWYVVHFGAVLRAGPGGVVDSPATGPGVPGPAGGC